MAKASEQLNQEVLQSLEASPLLLREFCCIVPGDQQHPCWHLFVDVKSTLPEPYVQCCFPLLRRLRSARSAPWSRELQEELRITRRWRGEDLRQAAQEEPR